MIASTKETEQNEMTNFNSVAQDTSRPQLVRDVAEMMYSGFCWDFIKEKLGDKAGPVCSDLTREISGCHVMEW